MSRLPRPYIPVRIKVRVALGQLGEMWPDAAVAAYSSQGKLLAQLLERLAALLGCTAKDFHLDHDPPLGARHKIRDKAGEIIGYVPDANDPEYLRYRPHGPQFAGSHLVKTNVRGDHGQHPDRVLIKRQRRLEKGASDLTRNGKKGRRLDTARGTIRGKSFQQSRCALGVSCQCNRKRRKRCGNYKPARLGR